jgi:undecaprenyl-diphosphatase
MLQHFDFLLFHAVNSWCGNWLLDRMAKFEEWDQLTKGAAILSVYWWYWFAGPENRREANRRHIVGALLGVLIALILARALADVLPERVRPMYNPYIAYRPPSLPINMNLENWSAFPSDTAAFFLGLAFGIFRLSRRVSIFLLIYASVWICLPRVYLGIHYPSDLLAGAAIGILSVWVLTALTLRQPGFAQAVMTPVRKLEQQRPELFYAAAFILSFEMATVFLDVRTMECGLMKLLRLTGLFSGRSESALFLIQGSVLTLAVIFWAGRKLVRKGHA